MSDVLIMSKTQMEALAQRFRVKADEIAQLRAEVTQLLAGTTWDSNRARRFRDDWAGSFAPSLSRLQQALEDNAAFVGHERANAITAMD